MPVVMFLSIVVYGIIKFIIIARITTLCAGTSKLTCWRAELAPASTKVTWAVGLVPASTDGMHLCWWVG